MNINEQIGAENNITILRHGKKYRNIMNE